MPSEVEVAGNGTVLYGTSSSLGLNGGLIGRRRFVPVPSRYEEMVNAPRTTVCPPSIAGVDRKSTRLNSSHGYISYAVFCLKKKKIYNLYSHVVVHSPHVSDLLH